MTAERVLAEVNRAQRTDYRLIRALTGGFQSGAWLITDSADQHQVLKWSPNRAWAPQIRRAASAVARVRDGGYPTPAWRASGVTGDGYGYQVQDFVDGSPRSVLDRDTAAKLIDVLELQRALDPDPDRSWSAYVLDQFTSHRSRVVASVQELGPAGRDLVEMCGRLTRPYAFPDLPARDLVHGDFRLGNVIFDHGKVSGVIDIEAIGSGTRAFDYATLLDHDHADEDAVSMIVEAGADVAGPDVLAHCLVHVVLDLALFVNARQPPDPGFLDRRVRALTERARLVGRLLGHLA